jgi:lysyl-tRNA synthetase class 2
VNVFRFIPGYTHGIYDSGKEPIFLLFVAFLVTFILTRLYTRIARQRGWGSASAGGVHMHHMVPGVILMSVAGILSFSALSDSNAAWSVLALLFGVGVALTLDEFAMIFYVRDVYWTDEGRTSVDAMLMGIALMGLLLVGFSPFNVNESDSGGSGLAALAGLIAFNGFFAAIVFLKKKPFIGTVSIFVVLVGIISSIRLAKPGSPWAHWFYDPERGSHLRRKIRERKHRRSVARFESGWFGRFERRFSDLVGGAPSLPSSPLETETERKP